MATTPNIGLYKPTRDDYVSVQRDLSNNYELIDDAVGKNNILINDMDIIVNGNTASVNVTAGQFVTVRNSTIVGITDGIYKAKNNVASGTVFTSSNLENITGGVLNALNEQIGTLKISTNENATDCNTVSGNKAYSIISSTLNRPFDWGTLFDVSPNGDGLGYRMQIAISVGGECCIRGRNSIGGGAIWSQWKTVQVS